MYKIAKNVSQSSENPKAVVTQEFADAIKRWIELDDAIKLRNSEIRQIKSQKVLLDGIIKEYMEKNKIQQKDITISNGDKIRYKNSTRLSPINREYIYTRILEYLHDENKAKDLTNYIFNNRDTTTNQILSRYKGKK